MSKNHILLKGLSNQEKYSSRRRGRTPGVPLRDRNLHGSALSNQYHEMLNKHEQRKLPNPISQDVGIYIQITSRKNYELPLKSLDTSKGFKLCSSHEIDGYETAVVYIPENKRDYFLKKINEYLDPSKDGKYAPRNHNLIDSIEEIRLAELKSFWTDKDSLYPSNRDELVWWEIWLKKGGEQPASIAHQLVNRINGQLGNTSISFFDNEVFLIKASIEQLEKAPDLIASLEELRSPKDSPKFFIEELASRDQYNWIEDLNKRISINLDSKVAVCIIDSGINYNHPLLKNFCSAEFSECWQPDWPKFDYGSYPNFYGDHASRQGGLAVFGDLQEVLLNQELIQVNHMLESARIIPPNGENEPELYGEITIGAVSKHEIARPDWNRVCSLAVTADSTKDSGQPSSWSAKIDQFCFGYEDKKQRLFIISTGNNRNISPALDYWDQVQLAEIEDPAQSWNAITVGAYTQKTTNNDPELNGWSPFAMSHDVTPSSRSSVNWAWRKNAPFKPDIVAEGGNRLLSPNKTEVTNADTISLLTTSGRTSGQFFEITSDTSAACALVSRYAALLMDRYPNYWPETIRALLVHSADWTSRMRERFESLQQHTLKIAKETMLRTVGYGVPNIERALNSTQNKLTLIIQGELQPFNKLDNEPSSTEPKFNEMGLHKMPIPIELLQNLPSDLEVSFKVTLSYFIEPKPGRRGYRNSYSYQSHGLRLADPTSYRNFAASSLC